MCFHSPYEAAAWAIIGHRVRIAQAARVKARMAEALGRQITVDSRTEHAFPGPSRLARLTSFPGLTETKVGRLRNLALAAGEGKLEAGPCVRYPSRRRCPGSRSCPVSGLSRRS